MTWPGSAVIHDIKGENWQLTAGWRSRFSHCLLLDPTNPLSARFNPLLEVRKGFHEVRDVHNIADILIDPEGARPWRDHWEKSAHSLLTGAILHVLYAEEEKTLARVGSFLADPARSIRRTMWVMLTTNHLGTEEKPQVHPTVALSAREIINKTDNERSGVVSTVMTLLGLYRDPIIARMTSGSDWRIADLLGAERPVSLYLVVPPSDISRTRPLVRLILNQIGRRLTERYDAAQAGADARQLLLMLDEFPALGRLDFFESALATWPPTGCGRSWWRSRCTRSTRRTGTTTRSSITAMCGWRSPPTTSARPGACPTPSAPRRSSGPRGTCRDAGSRPGSPT
jgi:type IV secretion system protein VirD4